MWWEKFAFSCCCCFPRVKVSKFDLNLLYKNADKSQGQITAGNSQEDPINRASIRIYGVRVHHHLRGFIHFESSVSIEGCDQGLRIQSH